LTVRAYGVGIDTHSRFIAVTVLVPNFQTGRDTRYQRDLQTSIPGLCEGREWALSVLKSHAIAVTPEQPLHYTIEATSCYHFPVIRCWGGKPAVVNPNLLKAGRRKTDDIDARSLAAIDLNGRWPSTYVYPEDQMGLRVLLRLHKRHARAAGMWGKVVNSQLLKFGVTLARLGSLLGSEVRPCVEDLLAGRPLVSADARACVPDENVPPWLRPFLAGGCDESDRNRDRAVELWKQVRARLPHTLFRSGDRMVSGKEGVKLLETIPGVGEVTAIWLLAEVGDYRRFPTANACAAWSGCDLSLRISAGQVTSYTRRKGHSHIHWLLVQAAPAALRGTEELARGGQARVKRGGKGAKQRAVGAVAWRIIGAAWCMLCRAEPWKPSKTLKEGCNAEAEAEVPGAVAGAAGAPGTGRGGGRGPRNWRGAAGVRPPAGSAAGGRDGASGWDPGEDF
jgi:transposase